VGVTHAVVWQQPRNEPPPCANGMPANICGPALEVPLELQDEGAWGHCFRHGCCRDSDGCSFTCPASAGSQNCFRPYGSPMVMPGLSMASWCSNPPRPSSRLWQLMSAAVKSLTSPLVRCNVLRALKFGPGALHPTQTFYHPHDRDCSMCSSRWSSLTDGRTGMGYEDILPAGHGIGQDICACTRQHAAQIMGRRLRNAHALRDSVSGGLPKWECAFSSRTSCAKTCESPCDLCPHGCRRGLLRTTSSGTPQAPAMRLRSMASSAAGR
jgi:hypothetical protein